jgi:hypothetical protein
MQGPGHLLTMSGAYAAGRVLAEARAHVQRAGYVCRGWDTHAETGTCMQRPKHTCKGWDMCAEAGGMHKGRWTHAEAGVTYADSRVDTGEGR